MDGVSVCEYDRGGYLRIPESIGLPSGQDGGIPGTKADCFQSAEYPGGIGGGYVDRRFYRGKAEHHFRDPAGVSRIPGVYVYRLQLSRDPAPPDRHFLAGAVGVY
ncbi:hypothetical protein FQZ97_1093820 [compost metagenome]